MSTRASSRRLVRLGILAAPVGLAAGGAAYVLVHLIGLLTNLALFHRWGWDLPSFRDLQITPGTYVAHQAEPGRARTAVAKPLSAAFAIGSGGRVPGRHLPSTSRRRDERLPPSPKPSRGARSPSTSATHADPALKIGEQRCAECSTFMHRVGIGGACPCCDELIAAELLEQEVITTN